MFQTILMPLDGSPLAERAIPYAAALARATGARLLLARAAVSHTFPGVDPNDALVGVMSEAEVYLERAARPLCARGLTVDTAVPYGEAADALPEERRLREADLVVMATHGRSGLGRWVYGSVAAGVLARSPVPVLLVRAWQAALPLGDFGLAPALLVPLDGSALAAGALGPAHALAAALGGSLTLLRVVPFPTAGQAEDWALAADIEEDVAAMKAEASAYLEQVAAPLRARELPVECLVRVGAPAEEIVTVTAERGAALVAMGTHGRSGLGRLVLGSVADAVLRQGRAPLLLVPPPERIQAAAPDEAITGALTRSD